MGALLRAYHHVTPSPAANSSPAASDSSPPRPFRARSRHARQHALLDCRIRLREIEAVDVLGQTPARGACGDMCIQPIAHVGVERL